ncbi:hypothetical protein C6W19_24215 [Bacillus sp. RJGP41]|nr:hypothetical protein C6W19_24215 [Bacillus sp. RJGP41]
MEKVLNPAYIERFRDLMNYGNYGYKTFSNLNGKDDWALICSHMDWIEAWVNEIEDIKTNGNDKYRDTINIAQFILGIDTIVTATKRTLEYFNINHFNILNSKTIFTKEHFTDNTDLDYFKKIRSTCAIHPTDIQAGKGKKFYAGWVVNDMFVGPDFNIFVYHDKTGHEDICLDVKKNELILFAKAWYEKFVDLNLHLEKVVPI